MKRSTIKLSNDARFRLAVHTALLAGVSTMATTAVAQDATEEKATELEAVEVTGSRLGRADIEGALPVATITREDIDRSGFTSVAELLRNTTFNSLGAFRAQSGSSAQSLVAVDLRGLGSERTLVLIDGRRAPKAPFAPSAQDLNAVPIAMVERIEVLKDGASAIYGSDAIAGVINIITRKDYQGASMTYQRAGTDRKGGDSHGGQFVTGLSGERGNLVFGASFFSRDIIFARDAILAERGASFFSNNYTLILSSDQNNDGIVNGNDDWQAGEFYDWGPDGVYGCDPAVPGSNCQPGDPLPDAGEGDYFDDVTGNYYYGPIAGGCPNSDPAFYITGAGNCGYDFNLVAADEADTGNRGVFVKGNYKISDNWQVSAAGSVSRATSFGRYAPSLNDIPIVVPDDSPNNMFFLDAIAGNEQPLLLYHRFAALGTRDNNTDANVYDLSGIFSGQIGDINVDLGVRHNDYQYYELGSNYVVLPIASQRIADGTYDIFDPTVNNPVDVLGSMKATITRDSVWKTLEYFVEGNMPLFSMGGGTAAVAAGLEYRTEQYQDQYDSLQQNGAIGGSAGNSSGTTRQVKSLYAELFLPVMDQLEVSFSGRFEDYDDVGNNFAPKVSARFQPTDAMTLRASAGTGFRAPTLDIISALPTYSAEPINNDEATCVAAGGVWDNPGAAGSCNVQQQVSTTIISNPALDPEESTQFSFGFAMDLTQDIDFSIDYYNISLTDRLNFIDPGELIDRFLSGDPIPAGLSVDRSTVPVACPGNPTCPGRIIGVTAGYANEGDLDTSGLDIVFNARQGLGDFGMLSSNLMIAYILEYKIDSGRDTVGDPAVPQYRATLNNTWRMGAAAVALNANHIADQAQRVNAGGVQTGHIPSYTTWDVQAAYELPFLGGTELAVGALNVFGREPSRKSAFDGRDYNFYLYDQYGTQPYVKFTQKF